MTIHNLKIQKCFLEKLLSGEKKAELRKNDRDYQTGDVLLFDKSILWEDAIDIPAEILPQQIAFKITHVLNSNQTEGLLIGYVILSVKRITK